MKKMLLVLCLIAFASLTASATTGYTVAFNGYCDGVSIANNNNVIFGGVHNLTSCPYNNRNGGGFKHAAAGYTYYTGAAFDFSDTFAASLGYNESQEVLINVAGTPTHPVKCGWVYYTGNDGVGNYYTNSGLCTIVSRPLSRQQVKGLKPAGLR